MCVACITNIRPIITKKTILIAIIDMTRAPRGPVNEELIDTSISTTPSFLKMEKIKTHPVPLKAQESGVVFRLWGDTDCGQQNRNKDQRIICFGGVIRVCGLF